jgi:nicotinamide-nucleotide amidase
MVELVAVGSELLRHARADTNSGWLTRRLHGAGLEVTARAVVDDDAGRIASVVGAAWQRSEAVVVTGGLGPTVDDRTREGIAAALGRPLESDPLRLEQLERLYGRYGRTVGEPEARQAARPAGAAWIDNPLGSAAGFLVAADRRLLAALPGVPAEMRDMFERDVLPRLRPLATGVLGRATLRVAGRTESSTEQRLADVLDREGLDVTVLGGVGGVELHVRARGRDRDEVEARLLDFEKEVRRRLGEDVFATDDESLAAVVGALLRERGRTVATAESCTAGLLGAELTSEAGSSAWYRGGLIVYDNELKRCLAGVRAETLDAHGAVSEEVARELAAGARERCGADLGVGITGVAGPGGGTEEKPVGQVHVAIQDGEESLHWRLRLIGDRASVRARAVAAALDRLRRRLVRRT